jgi:protein-tyrosine phosphatase
MCDEIINHLYVGGLNSFETKNDFSLIVNCTKNEKISNQNNINFIRIPINDDPYESEKMLMLINELSVIDIIHNTLLNNNDVLVHCSAGMQRSCALVACYLIKYHNMKPIDAINYIKSKRRIAFFGNVNLLSTIEQFYQQQI